MLPGNRALITLVTATPSTGMMVTGRICKTQRSACPGLRLPIEEEVRYSMRQPEELLRVDWFYVIVIITKPAPILLVIGLCDIVTSIRRLTTMINN